MLMRHRHSFGTTPWGRLLACGALIVATTLSVSFLAVVPAHADIADGRWQPDTAAWHWGRDRQIDLLDTKLEIVLDPLVVRVSGSATLTFVPLHGGLEHLRLDAERLTIERVRTADGTELDFDVDDRGFEVHFKSPPAPAETTAITIDYHGAPTMGLYFIPSVAEDPDKIPMIWSQGEMEENRFWFPGYDYPDDKATSAVSVRTPRPNIVISNGALTGVDDHADGTRTFHWVEGVRNSTYLIALVVGQFDSLVEHTVRGLPVSYYCRKGKGETLARSFGETPGMVEFFEDAIGVPFPYEKYAQVIVTDFIWGGMENASMTIENERTLSSAAARPFDRDRTNGLVAHELAHQWFGDLLTMHDWAHTWLNEGFATYFTRLWEEHRWGHDYFLLSTEGTRAGGRGASGSYRRSIVHHQFADPDDMFDGHAYSKAASVLHMIRGQIGDSLWWKAINRYVTRYREQNVESEDFKRVLEEVTGRDFDAFFHQWFYRGGHPKLKIKTRYDTPGGVLRIDIEQTQTIDEVTPVYNLSVDIEWMVAGRREMRRFVIDQKDNSFFIPLEGKPSYILIDPEGWLLAAITYKQSKSDLLAQINDTERVLGRLTAVRGLGHKEPSPEVLAALTRYLRADPMAAIRREAAASLARIGGSQARDSLLVGLGDDDLQTRNSVIHALGKFRGDDTAFAALERLARSDALVMLRGSAVDAAASVDPARAIPLARRAATQKTEKFTLAVDAFSALRKSKDPALIDFGLKYARKGHDPRVRIAAVGMIAGLAKYENDAGKRERASRALELYLDDRNMLFRRPLMGAIGALGRTEAIPELERVQRQSPQHRERDDARAAIAKIRKRDAKDKTGEVANKVADAATERKRLKKRIENLEKRIDALSKKSGTDTDGDSDEEAESDP